MRDSHAPPEDLDQEEFTSPRDELLVNAIAAEGLSVFSFDGLRRITGAHPETLSRSLERLEERGILVKSPGGYSVTGKVRGSLSMRPAGEGPGRVPILQTFLPYDGSAGAIASALRGRWFDTIRWVGMAEGEGEVVMKWVTEDGSVIIDARIGGGRLEIDAKLAKEADLPKAVKAAHQLMGRISRLYSGTRPGGKPALMRVAHFEPYAM